MTHANEPELEITFIAKDPGSNPTGSPTLYRTNRGSWIVQGWNSIDAATLAKMDIPDGEGAVEIPDRLVPYFFEKGTQ